ncbi:MAG: TolC family protein, partial [Alphaproteobacteria bacterium]|nr:TolC family protein [Alphaproteobacteria bacterium]
ARAGVRAAGHGVIDSYIGFGPRVTATYDQQRERQNVMATQNPVYQTGKAYFGNQIGYGEAVQPVFDYRLFAQLKGAQAGERRESYLATAAEQKVIYSLVEAYLLALSANDSYALSQVEAKNLQSHQGEIKEKIKSGLANEGDLDEVEARYGLARARMIQAAAAVSEAFAAIERIAGIAAPALMPLKGAIPVPRPDPARPEDWVIAVLQGNPELLAANETITVARADFDKAIGGHLPRADLRATYNRSNTGGSLYGGGSNTDDMLLTLRVTVPIFNSQGQGLQFLQAKERERQAQLNWDVRRRELVQKTQTTYLEVVSNSERVKILSSAAAAQEKVAAGRRTKFQTGLTNITDVLDAEAASYRAKREYLAARYNYLLTMMQLKELAGAISPTDIGFIDSLLDPRQRPVRRIAL